MVTFYALAFPLLILRIYITLYYFVYIFRHQILPFLMPQTLTFLMGLDLCWIITELSLRIRQSLKASGETIFDRRLKRHKSPERFIKRGRIVVTILICIFAVGTTVAFVVIG